MRLAPRALDRLHHTATRCQCGAFYGALVALTGFYGIVSWGVITVAATVFAVACTVLARE